MEPNTLLITDTNPTTLPSTARLMRHQPIYAVAVLMDDSTDPDTVTDLLRQFAGAIFLAARDAEVLAEKVGTALELLDENVEVIAIGTHAALPFLMRSVQEEGYFVACYFNAELATEAMLLCADHYILEKGEN